jgi:hypothetical protein
MDRSYLPTFIIWSIIFMHCDALHLKGSWESNEFQLFLAKFGFQQTDLHNQDNTQGYIYGNVTSNDPRVTNSMTLVLTDSEYFLEFYGNRSMLPRTRACTMMFAKLDAIAWDLSCNSEAQEDFLRKVPCPKGEYCTDEDDVNRIIPGGNQFTFRIRDTNQPR